MSVQKGRYNSFPLFSMRKGDNYLFSIVRVAYLLDNISSAITYSVFWADILGITRTATTYNVY